MSDTPPRKPGVPTLTTIGYAGSLTGKNPRPPAGAVSPSTQQGFAPVLPEQLRALELLEQAAARGKTPPYPVGLNAPVPPAPPAAAPAPASPPTVAPPSARAAHAQPAVRVGLTQVAPVIAPARSHVAQVAPTPAAAPAAHLPATTTTPRERSRAPGATASPAAARPRPASSTGFDEAMTNVWKQLDTDLATDEIAGGRRFLRWWLLLPVVPLIAVFAYLLFGSPEAPPAASPGNTAASLSTSSGSGPGPASPAQSGDSVVIGRGTIALRVEAAGQVRGLARAEIQPELEGVIAEVHVRDGQQVKQGERLITFDVASSRKQLKALSQAIVDRKAELHVQRLRRDAIRRDLRSGLLWPAEMEAAEAELKQAEARLRSATAARRRAQERARSRAIEAPMDGVVSGLAVTAGQKVTPTPAGSEAKPLLVIEDAGKLLVAADLPPEAATRVAVDSPARVTISGLGRSAFDAQLVGIPEAPVKNDAGATVYPLELRVDVGADAAKVAPGTTSAVHFQIGQKKDVLVLPLTAVKTDNAGRTVEVWSSELMQYERRVVQTGEHDESHVEVVGNLAEGDRVRIVNEEPSKG